MPQLLALEWNGSEARLVLASGRGDQVVIEQAFAVEMRSRIEGDKSEVDIGSRLVAALGARGIGRVETLVAIGRTNIELRQLSLPPAPDEELPDLVRFQAMREFNELADDWLLDYVPLTDSPNEPRNVLAAAVGPDLVAQIQQTCEKAGLKPKRLVLRACAAASLLSHTQAARQNELRLLVDLLSDEADLTVINDGRVIFMRTTRLSADGSQTQALFGEIRRTMAAVQNQLAGRKVESVVLCGGGIEQSELAARIQAELDVTTELFDPFGGLQLGRELQDSLPDHPGRFTPLLGLLVTEFSRHPHAVDFLHPRKRPTPPNKWRKFVLPAVAAVVVLFGYVLLRQWDYNDLHDKVEALNRDSTALDKQLEQAEKRRQLTQNIEKWAIGDVNWLDRFYELNEKLPPASDVMLSHLTLRSTATGGEADVTGYVKSVDVLKNLESKSSSQDTSHPPYSWSFSGTKKIPSDFAPEATAKKMRGTPPTPNKNQAIKAKEPGKKEEPKKEEPKKEEPKKEEPKKEEPKKEEPKKEEPKKEEPKKEEPKKEDTPKKVEPAKKEETPRNEEPVKKEVVTPIETSPAAEPVAPKEPPKPEAGPIPAANAAPQSPPKMEEPK
jgi:Tfp pilus assembly PilM family ATPase